MYLAKTLRSFHMPLMVAATTATCMGAIGSAEAKVTAFFSAGTTCTGAQSANFVAAGAPVKVSLCVTVTTEALCGHTTKLQANDTSESGHFNIVSLVHAVNFADPNAELTFPIAIRNPADVTDFGATVARTPFSVSGKQLLVTFDISPQRNAAKDAYTIALSPHSSVSVGIGGTCTMPMDFPITATFKLIQRRQTDARK